MTDISLKDAWGMPPETGVRLERSTAPLLEDVVGPPLATGEPPPAAAIPLSLHRDLAEIERDWKSLEARAI